MAIARELGDEGFGDFMFALSFTTVLMLASGFGTEGSLLARWPASAPASTAI